MPTKTRLDKLFLKYFDTEEFVEDKLYFIDGFTIKKLKAEILHTRIKATPEQIEEVYKSYPSKCVVRGASNGKTLKNKKKIGEVIDEIGFEKLIKTIEIYTEQCKKHNTYMKNFSTFLNNIPDYDTEYKEQKPKSDEELYLSEEERMTLDNNIKQELIFKRKKEQSC